MEMQHCDAFDYWGKGTEVTVSSGPTVSPVLFPLVQCNPGSENKITVGCLARDFSPSKSLTFQWRDNSGTALTSVQYPVATNNNKHTGVSLLSISKSNWDSSQTFECNVTYHGNSNKVILKKKESPTPKITLLSAPRGDTQTLVCTVEDLPSSELTIKWKKDSREQTGSTDFVPKSTGNVGSAVSVLKVKNTDWDSDAVYTCDVKHRQETYTKKVTKAPFTVTLSQPSAKDIFENNEVKLECIISGRDQSIVNGVKITWEIDGLTVTNNINESRQHTINSTMTRSLAEWQRVNNVRCSASSEDVTPVIQDLTVHKGDGSKPKVTVQVLQEEVINNDNSGDVTLVCLVSSSVQQDYYIAWVEYTGPTAKVYKNGINFPQQKTQNGHLVTSVYTANKAKWNQNNMFECNVWHAGGDGSITVQNVSKAKGNSLECDK